MAQTGYTPIQLYHSATTTNAPTGTFMAAGELAINTADGKLFYKDNVGNIKVIASTASALGTGTSTSILYGNGTGGFSNVTVGSGLAFVAGTLTSTGSGGTVTSVGLSAPGLFTVTNSPVTGAGTLTLSYSGTALPTANGGTALTSFTSGGALYATSTSALTTGTLPIASGGNNSTATPTAGTVHYGTGTAWGATAAGTAGQVLTSAGAGTPTWTTISVGGGSVTSVAMTVPAFLSIAGSPITSSGTLAVSLSGTALPVLNGGTGVTTSTGTVNNVLSASPTLTGTPLAPTATAGTNTTQIATTAFVNNSIGSTWQDVLLSRVAGTTYTNSTGKTIEVNIQAASLLTTSTCNLVVSGIQVAANTVAGITGNIGATLTALVPNNATYVFNQVIASSYSLNVWTELR